MGPASFAYKPKPFNKEPKRQDKNLVKMFFK